ncbi:hypothetical protein BGX28_000983 [Mortierella sp. GBA30]|nr:hypothetical protein BGX28_000983 [Mortierella sp. GBA30]
MTQKPQFEEIRKNMEALSNLPEIMSPTIPPWPTPSRNTIGGKQLGKLPKMPGLGGSSDDSSDSGSDSDNSSMDADSENVSMSDVDVNTLPRQQIGRKTSGRKSESVGGKRPAGAVSGKAVPESARHSMDSLARKTSLGQCCCVLTSRQVAELPRRHLGMVMASSPLVIKINIPTYLLPALNSVPRQLERSKAYLKSISSSKPTTNMAHRRVYSDDEQDMDVGRPPSTDKEDGVESSRQKTRESDKKDSKTKESNVTSSSAKNPPKRSRSYFSEDDSDMDERKKSKNRHSKDKGSMDLSYDQKKMELDSLLASGGERKRSAGLSSSAKIKMESIDDKRSRDDRRPGSVEAPVRVKNSHSLSPILDRNKKKTRPPSYYSADEDDVRDSHRSQSDHKYSKQKGPSDNTDGRSRLENKGFKSKSDFSQARRPGGSKDRDTDASEARRKIREDGNARETKEKVAHLDKPSSASTKERKLAKEDDFPVSSRAGSKNESNPPKSDRSGSTAAPSSPGRRSGNDNQKDTKPRGDRDSRDDTTSSGQRSSRPEGGMIGIEAHLGTIVTVNRIVIVGIMMTIDLQLDASRMEGKGTAVEIATTDPAEDAAGIDSGATEVVIGIGVETGAGKEAGTGAVTEARNEALAVKAVIANGHVPDQEIEAPQPSHHESNKTSAGRRESESKHAMPVATLGSLRRPSQAIKEQTPSPPIPRSSSTSLDARGPQDSLPSSSSAAPSVKRVSIEDYQRKRNSNAENNVDTPKAASDSPALASGTALSGKPSLIIKEAGQKAASGDQKSSNSASSSSKPSSETGKKIAEYYNTFRLRRAEGTTFKHSADDTLKNQNNPRLGAIQYFLSANEFIGAFHANDKYHTLSNPGRPDVAVKESIKSWETMRQFIYALTNQCHSNHLSGLDGVSALMEVLVYYKCYNFNIMALRKDMLRSDQFKNKPPGGGSKDETVAITQDMAGRMLQNVEDWAHIQKRMDDCRQWLTADIAREQFPDTFRRWCVHPDQIGQGGMSFDRFVPGTTIQKIHWPLGMHLHLHELMGFVEAALDEYQKRNGLEHSQRKK